MTITSYIPGRIRVRDNRLADAAAAEQIIAMVKLLPGIRGISVNHRTASLLVQYDPASGAEALLRSHAGIEAPDTPVKPAAGRRKPGKKKNCCITAGDFPITYRQFLNYGMMAAFAASGIGIALHYRKLHAAAGFLFFGLSGLHMYNKRRTLFV